MKVRVVAQRGYDNFFTIGKTYNLENGILDDDTDTNWYPNVDSVEELNDWFGDTPLSIKFEEVKETTFVEIIDHDYHVGELVRCINTTDENHEGLVVGELYTVLGSTFIPNNTSIDKLYTLRSKSGDLVHSMDRFERVFETVEVEKATTNEFDTVEKPSHYNQYSIEVIDLIGEVTAGLSGMEAVAIGNVVKYVMRYQFKNGVEDLKKAKKYLSIAIECLETKQTRMITQRQICYVASLTSELRLDRYNLPSYLSPIKNYKELTEVEASVLISKLVAMKDYMNDISRYTE